MRMPFLEFITGGDLKFMILLTVLLLSSILQLSKKITESKKTDKDISLINLVNANLNKHTTWVGVLSLFSLMLGLMHSFYFIGKVGGAAPGLIFQGLSHTLVTPVFGLAIYMLIKVMQTIFNDKPLLGKSN
jgi:hypothetical protein